MNRLIENGISERAVARFLDEAKRLEVDLHSMEIWRNGVQAFALYGYPYTPETMHRMYSSGKMLVALAAMKAIEENKLELTSRVTDYFPGRLPEDLDEKFSGLTVYHMLTMNTGHAHDTMWSMRADKDWIHGFFSEKPERAPGEFFFYNNGAPFVLSHVVKEAVKMDYLDYLKQRFFKEMDVRTEADLTPDGSTDSSGVSIRMGDFPKLARLLLDQGRWNGKQLLDPGLASMMGQYHVSSIQSDQVKNVAMDTRFGYGFYLWRNSVGGYRLDGGRGQFGLVFPDLNMTVSFMASEEDQGLIPELFWKQIYPYCWSEKAPEGERAGEEPGKTWQALPGWDRVYGDKSGIDGCTYVLEENEMGMEEIRFEIGEEKICFTGVQKGEQFRFEAGLRGGCSVNEQFPEMPEYDWFMDHVSGNSDDRFYVQGEFYRSEDFTGKREIRIYGRNLRQTQYWVWNFRIADGGIRIEVDHGAWYCVKNRGRLELLPHIPAPVMIFGTMKEE